MESLQVTAGPYTFEALAAGPADGRPVVFLHGFPQSKWEWRGQLALLGDRGYRAVAFDQRGYSPGARPTDPADYQMRALVGDVLGVADSLGFARFDVVGHDWGGPVAWNLGTHHPDRVRSLTVVSTPHPRAFNAAMHSGGEQATRSSYMHVFRQVGTAEDLLLADDARRLRELYANSGLADFQPYLDLLGDREALTGGLNWYRGSSREDAEWADRVGVPTLYVWGDQDPALGREAAEATATWVDGPYRFEALAGVGHWVAETAADRFDPLLLEHLAAT